MANIRGGKSNYEQDTETTVVDNQFSPEEVSEKVFNTGGDKTIGELYNAGVFNQSEPTVGQYSDFSAPSYSDPYGDAVKQNLSFADFNENQVRSDVLSQFQGETNATKAAYAQLLKNVRQEGKGRLGENTALQARRGLLGSDFGAGQTAETKDFNQSQEEKVLAAQAAALAGIKSNALKIAQNEVISRRAAKQQGSEAYLSYLSGAGERKQNNLNTIATSFLSQGVDPMSISPQELEAIAGNFGVTTDDIINSYIQGKTAQEQAEAERQAELQKELSFNLSEGQARYQYNPETGQTELVASRAKTYAPSSGGGQTNQMTDNERAAFAQFRGEPIVKNYNEVLNKKISVDAILERGVGGPADLALVFEFMKALDPTSVVRESEYDAAAKSGNIFAGAYTKFNGYFKEKGGILPENVKQEFQNITNLKLDASQRQYDNLSNQYRAVAERQGLNPDNVVINYGFDIEPVEQTPEVTTLDSLRQEFPNATEEELKEVLVEEVGINLFNQ